jgi:3-oxoacyl-[acyl-carrier protein] reductase
MSDLQGRVAIVTGGARGIGAAIVHRLRLRGAAIVIADIDEHRAKQIAESLGSPDQGIALTVDVSSKSSVESMVSEVVSRLGGVHILVNNAAVAQFDISFENLSEDEWRRVLGVNLDGVFFCMQAVIPIMKSQQYGRVVNIAALGGKIGALGPNVDYAASKGGVLALTKYGARTLAQYGITVNAVVPGPIGGDTMARFRSKELLASAKKAVPLGRLGRPEDIASVVEFLVSESANWVTGEVIDVNGGFYID